MRILVADIDMDRALVVDDGDNVEERGIEAMNWEAMGCREGGDGQCGGDGGVM